MSVHNPWGQLLSLAEQRPPATVAARSGKPTEQLLSLIEQSPHKTGELAAATRLPSRLVWGLLKNARSSGRVLFSAGIWTHNSDYLPPEIARAVDLLRAAGWRVERPS